MEIYTDIINYISDGAKSMGQIGEHICKCARLTEKESGDVSASGNLCRIKANIGSLITQMTEKNVIAKTADGKYYAKIDAPTALRLQRCEHEILKMLSRGALSKAKITSRLVKLFETDKTRTKRDDNMLNVFIADTLRSLSEEKIIVFDGSVYSISKEKYALATDKSGISRIKSDFLSLLHSRGGEFFEYYFMNLLEKYLRSIGKTVTRCDVLGGASDGGIDGIAETRDQLGFREVIMVQTKNRADYTTELDIRGFYGAVNAKRGTRGIYATTSGFHPIASKLLSELDDCVGVDGDKIFDMAKQVGYGIITEDGKIKIDTALI